MFGLVLFFFFDEMFVFWCRCRKENKVLVFQEIYLEMNLFFCWKVVFYGYGSLFCCCWFSKLSIFFFYDYEKGMFQGLFFLVLIQEWEQLEWMFFFLLNLLSLQFFFYVGLFVDVRNKGWFDVKKKLVEGQ